MSTSAAGMNGKLWPHVTRAHPCPVCGKPDWCRAPESRDVAACYRVAQGGEEKTDSSGATYYLHRLTQPTTGRTPEPRYSPSPERADADTLHRVYSALLSNLTLSQQHIDALQRRGIKDKSHYRTLNKSRSAAVRSIISAGMESSLPGVPGLYLAERDGKRYWSVVGWGGMLIPVCDVERRIVALMLRADEGATGAKYRYLSSKKKGGAGPGAPVHIPRNRPKDTNIVCVTEGALKADAATELSGIPTIGLPGVADLEASARGPEIAWCQNRSHRA